MSQHALVVTILLAGCTAGQPANLATTDDVGSRNHAPAIASEMDAPRGPLPKRVATYASAENGIYLIDDADFYTQHDRTLDDALAHELVHYLQANYLEDGFNVEWSEAEAISVQTWFRKEYMAAILTASAKPSTETGQLQSPSQDN